MTYHTFKGEPKPTPMESTNILEEYKAFSATCVFFTPAIEERRGGRLLRGTET